MRILVAFDKFKDSLSANEACHLASSILLQQDFVCEPDILPLTDGGEGFTEILTDFAGGSLKSSVVQGPLGKPAGIQLGFVEAGQLPPEARQVGKLPSEGLVAVIEMASAVGLSLLSSGDRNPWETRTHGVGEMIRMAADMGVAAILLGIGGSSTNDLGLGALQALGLRFLDHEGAILEPIRPSCWDRLAFISGRLPPLPPIRIACDVDNLLLGDSGATMVFGPQKGLKESDLAQFEGEAARVASIVLQALQVGSELLDEPCTGAAGGLGFGLRAATGASFVPGFSMFSAWMGLEKRLHEADLVITGEGCFDESSFSGKGPGSIVDMALEASKQVWVLAGSLDLPEIAKPNWDSSLLVLKEISQSDLPLNQNLQRTPENLAKVLQELILAENLSFRET